MFPFPEEPLPQDDFGEITDLVALCGRQYHEDDEGIDPAGAQQTEARARLDIVMPDYSFTRVVTECVSQHARLYQEICIIVHLPAQKKHPCQAVPVGTWVWTHLPLSRTKLGLAWTS
jgi:hypothetical protein